MEIEKVKHTVALSTNSIGGCDECHDPFSDSATADYLTAGINHYIEKHGYTLLHVGTETEHHDGKSLWSSTVAILGK